MSIWNELFIKRSCITLPSSACATQQGMLVKKDSSMVQKESPVNRGHTGKETLD